MFAIRQMCSVLDRPLCPFPVIVPLIPSAIFCDAFFWPNWIAGALKIRGLPLSPFRPEFSAADVIFRLPGPNFPASGNSEKEAAVYARIFSPARRRETLPLSAKLRPPGNFLPHGTRPAARCPQAHPRRLVARIPPLTVKPEILLLGYNPVLNRARRILLEPWFAVTMATSLAGALALISGKRFDLVLLDESIAEADCRAILEAVLELLPIRTKILALCRDPGRLGLAAPHEEFVSASVDDILHKAAAMTGIRVLTDAASPQPPRSKSGRTAPGE